MTSTKHIAPACWMRDEPDGPILFPAIFSSDILSNGNEYEPGKDDVIISSYPRSGNVWTQDIVYQLLNEGKVMENILDFDLIMPEMEKNGPEAISENPAPRIIRSHCSPGPLPLSVPFTPEAHYINVVRNPFDVIISYFHLWVDSQEANYDLSNFGDFYGLFMEGDILFGPHWNHVNRWIPHHERDNVLLLRYELLKSNAVSEIKRIANFLASRGVINNWFSDADIRKIHDNSKFNSMRKRSKQDVVFWREGKGHLRKGTGGGWNEYMTDKQQVQLAKKVREEVGDVAEDWWPEIFNKFN